MSHSTICHHCSARVPEGVIFCTRCGKSLESAPASSPPPPQPETPSDIPTLVQESAPTQTTLSSAPTGTDAPLSLLAREIEYLDTQFPWNLISLASVWTFLFLTYFV